MKKQIIALLMTFILCFGLVACASEQVGTSFGVNSAVSLLEQVWAGYSEDERFFIIGGDYEKNTPDKPDTFNPENTEYMEYMLCVPVDAASMIDNAASMVHMMNSNTFTCGAFHLANMNDKEAFINSVKEQVMNNQWLCGQPEKLVIISDDTGYVISAFGNGELIDNFKGKIVEMGGTVIIDEPIAS